MQVFLLFLFMNRSLCPITCTLDIIGDKWTLVILRDALFKNFTTYGQFQSSPEGISSNILAARLKTLVGNEIFKKQKDDRNKLIIHYTLTDKGRSLRSVILVVGLWGNKNIPNTDDIVAKIEAAKTLY
jgi:DNA-binding HxlR family transcriptional regulator